MDTYIHIGGSYDGLRRVPQGQVIHTYCAASRGHNDYILSKPISTLGSLRKTSEGEERERKERKEGNQVSLPCCNLPGIKQNLNWCRREIKALVGGDIY